MTDMSSVLSGRGLASSSSIVPGADEAALKGA
jgi:hypothetical protein